MPGKPGKPGCPFGPLKFRINNSINHFTSNKTYDNPAKPFSPARPGAPGGPAGPGSPFNMKKEFDIFSKYINIYTW